MGKVFCVGCGIYLHNSQEGMLGALQNIFGESAPNKSIEFEDGFRCQSCSDKKRASKS